MSPLIDAASELIRNARRALILTGAGISAESGVPTFRGGGGATTWKGLPFTTLSSVQMVTENLPLVWEWFDYRRSVLASCKPNDGHYALAAAESSDLFQSFIIVTQNIDGLHLAAGSKNVVEFHGNINEARCRSCREIHPVDELDREDGIPVCPLCSGQMRPNVVLFGEMLDQENVSAAYIAAERCDLCIVIGTSALVSPANILPGLAKEHGAKLIEINPEETPLTRLADISLQGPSAKVLPEVFSLK